MSMQSIMSATRFHSVSSAILHRCRLAMPLADVQRNPMPRPHLPKGRRGFGLNEVIGIAAGIIIAVIIVIPGLQVFAGNVIAQLTTWWNGMAADIFQG